MVVLIYNRLLIVAVALVASLKLGQMVNIFVSIAVPLDDNFIGSGAQHHAGVLCHNAHAGVNGRLALDSRTYRRRFRSQKGHCLTLHVGTHQGAVRIVVLQERNHSCSYREYHLRRNVHQVNGALLELGCLCAETAGYIIVNEMAFLIQRLVRLRHYKIVFLISGQVDYLIRNPRVCGIRCLIHHPVRSLDKAVLVNPGIGCQGVDQTDVGTLRSLDGAHTAVVGIVYVTHLESGTVSGQTAGAQGGKTPLVGQLSQRVVLIHELGQLGASEKLLHSSRHRLNID